MVRFWHLEGFGSPHIHAAQIPVGAPEGAPALLCKYLQFTYLQPHGGR